MLISGIGSSLSSDKAGDLTREGPASALFVAADGGGWKSICTVVEDCGCSILGAGVCSTLSLMWMDSTALLMGFAGIASGSGREGGGGGAETTDAAFAVAGCALGVMVEKVDDAVIVCSLCAVTW